MVVIQGYRNLSDHPLVSKFVEGIFNKHPPLPKYVKTWDINMVLELFDHMGDNSKLSFKDLTRKLVVFLLILGARRRNLLLQYKSIVYVLNMTNVYFYQLSH